MIKYIIAILLLMICIATGAKEKGGEYLGTNLILLSRSTLNLNYAIEIKPFVTAAAASGYMFNFDPNPDFNGDTHGYIKSNLCSCSDFGITAFRQNGGYLNLGGYINFRSVYDIQSFFRLGIFMHNSYLHELTRCWCLDEYKEVVRVTDSENSIYVSGLSFSLGYEFYILPRFKGNIEAKVAMPSRNYKSLNHYDTTIPGMGKEGQVGIIFPTLVVNLKYRLKD